MSWITDIMTLILPRAIVRREQAKTQISLLKDQQRRYNAASNTTRTKDWKASSTSLNAELRTSLDKLRARSRDMYGNNGHLRSAVGRLTTNIVGTGIRPSVEGASKPLERKIVEAFTVWAESEESDFDGRIDFYAMQSLVVRSVVMSGEAIIRRRRTEGAGGIPLQIQVQEGDVLDASRDGFPTQNGGYIKLGVEFDASGKRVAYWLYDEHPGEGTSTRNLISRRIPAEDVCHVFFVERPGQVRGVPWTVATMLKLRDLDQYEDAQIIRQKVAACFTAFVQDNDPTSALTAGEGIDYERLEPGRIEELPAGKTITFATPPPAEQYDPFTKGVLRSAASGIGITYEAMTNDYSNVNFSSGRMGWIEMGKQVQEWQLAMVKPFCNTIWRWFISSLVISGKIKEAQEKTRASWTPPRREMLDPVKEMKGISEQLKAGLLSYSEALRKQGYEPQDVMDELASDIQELDKLGIVPSWDGRLLKQTPGGGDSSATDNGS